MLATIGVLSLLLKKHREDKVAEQEERPVRTTKIWALDVSKQAFSGVCAQVRMQREVCRSCDCTTAVVKYVLYRV